MTKNPHAICAKWARRLGVGFNPDTAGADYCAPPLSAEEAAEYDADMADLFDSAENPHECAMMALADLDLI